MRDLLGRKRQVGATCTKLVVQDKSAKCTFPDPKQGPWLGTVSHIDQGKVIGLILLEKWVKTRGLIVELNTLIKEAVIKRRSGGLPSRASVPREKLGVDGATGGPLERSKYTRHVMPTTHASY